MPNEAGTSEPHAIRLRGPWQLEPLGKYVRLVEGPYRLDTDDLPPGGKTAVPGDWAELLGASFRGRVRYTRRFNCPTNLDACAHVWLVFDGVDHTARVALNGHELASLCGYQTAQRIDVSGALQPSNVLTVEVEMPVEVFNDPLIRPGRAGTSGGLVGEVRLEIGAPSTL